MGNNPKRNCQQESKQQTFRTKWIAEIEKLGFKSICSSWSISPSEADEDFFKGVSIA